ncbi:MAG: hypothetical protein BroJett040_15840 [Oligoflexia bacterium]|nr:MAG: hypothetical protein BroJett040_15840 [Oligoflexia bacterium]
MKLTRNQRGFSLLEVLVTAGLSIVIILIFSQQFLSYYKFQKRNEEVVRITNVDQIGARLYDIFREAEPTRHYLSVPVSVSCSNQGPCVKKVDPQTLVTSEISGSLAAQLGGKIQFYQNNTGNLIDNMTFYTKDGFQNQAYVSAVRPLVLSNKDELKDVYTVWNLHQNETPLPLLVNSDLTIKFSFVGSTASSGPSRQALLKSDQSIENSQDLEKIKQSYFLISNDFFPNNYIVVRAKEVIWCETNVNACRTAYPLVFSNPTLVMYNYFIFEFETLELEPRISSLRGLSGLTSWPNQGSVGIFPTNAPSVTPSPSSYSKEDLNPPFRLASWSHFYHANGIPENLIIRPVRLQLIRGQKKMVNDKPIYSISVETLPSGLSQMVVFDDLGGEVIVGRSLENNEIKFIFEGS